VLEEPAEDLHGLFKGLGELALLLVAPRPFEAAQAAVQAGEEGREFVVESVEVLGEPAKFGRIDLGFGHGASPRDVPNAVGGGLRAPNEGGIFPRASRVSRQKIAGG